ncbi:MAG: outer membrane beta-barrel protein [Hyphomicrobiales bacterium]
MSMKKSLASCAFAIGALGFSLSAYAGQEGLYMEGLFGGTFAADTKIQGDNFTYKNKFDTGYAFGGAAGYDFGNGLRIEGEVSYRNVSIDKFLSMSGKDSIEELVNQHAAEAKAAGYKTGDKSLSLSPFSADGSFSALSGMVNAAYGFDAFYGLKPYVMAGAGLAGVSINDAKLAGDKFADDHDVVFAYQAGLGVAYDLTDVATIDLGYYYFATAKPSMKNIDGDKFDSEFHTHNVVLGLRFRF